MSKMKNAMEFAQIVMINTQQEQEHQTNHCCQESPQLHVGNKVWLTMRKQYSTGRLNQKLNYKNQKYTVTEMVSSHAVHLNIKGVHSVFHVDWLCFTVNNPLSSQPQLDDQPAPIQVNGKEKWYINKIVAEEFCCHNCDVTKWFQIKYTEYAVSEWNQVLNLKETAVLEWWMEYTKAFWDACSRLLDWFQQESCSGQTHWWHCQHGAEGYCNGLMPGCWLRRNPSKLIASSKQTASLKQIVPCDFPFWA